MSQGGQSVRVPAPHRDPPDRGAKRVRGAAPSPDWRGSSTVHGVVFDVFGGRGGSARYAYRFFCSGLRGGRGGTGVPAILLAVSLTSSSERRMSSM
ncbi:hypothetical protein ACVIWV_008167 [Bradyrhizobium diazoefficiens]